MLIDEKFKDKFHLAQSILENRPDISCTHLARLVHIDEKRIRAWEHAGYLKFQPQLGGWKRKGWTFGKKSDDP